MSSGNGGACPGSSGKAVPSRLEQVERVWDKGGMSPARVLPVLVFLLAPGLSGRAQSPPRTLEELVHIAGKRAAAALKAGKKLLQRYKPDLSLSWNENREFVDRAVSALAARGSDLAPLLFPLLDPKGRDERSRNLAENAGRVLEKIGLALFLPRLVRLLREGSPLGRSVAARLLGASGRKEAVAPLLDALKDPDPPVVAAAVLSLGKLGAREARGPLLALLDRSGPALKEALLWSLAKVGRPEDLDKILPSFGEEKSERILSLFLDLVEKLGRENPKAALFAARIASGGGFSLSLRLRALEVLGRTRGKGDKEILALLKKLVADPLTPETLRRQTAYTLNALGDKSARNVVLGPAERFLHKNPGIPYAWVNRGDVYFNLGLYSKAASDYNRAIQLCGTRTRPEPGTWAQLFLCYLRMGKKRDLIRAVRRSRLPVKVLRELLAEHPELEKACRMDKEIAAAFQGKR